jgi:hypothetical protein
MSSVSYIETPQPERAQLNGTEEIRDCVSRLVMPAAASWGRVMTWALSEHVCVIGQQPLQGRTQERVWDGPRDGGRISRVSRGDGRAVIKTRLGSREA